MNAICWDWWSVAVVKKKKKKKRDLERKKKVSSNKDRNIGFVFWRTERGNVSCLGSNCVLLFLNKEIKRFSICKWCLFVNTVKSCYWNMYDELCSIRSDREIKQEVKKILFWFYIPESLWINWNPVPSQLANVKPLRGCITTTILIISFFLNCIWFFLFKNALPKWCVCWSWKTKRDLHEQNISSLS